jgi:multidrug efflux pump subunit AcrB
LTSVERCGQGHEKLIAARNAILGMASQDKRLAGVRPNGQEDTPQYKFKLIKRKLVQWALVLQILTAP